MKILPLFIGVFLTISGSAQHLIHENFSSIREVQSRHQSGAVTIHHLGSDFFIATTTEQVTSPAVAMKENPWNTASDYYLVWLPQVNHQEAINQLSNQFTLLYSDNEKAIVEASSAGTPGPKPFVHGGVVRISRHSSWNPQAVAESRFEVDTIPEIYDLMEEVDTGEFMPTIRHLENYGTRYCESPEAVEAQNWIKAKFEAYPELEVELQDFPFPFGESSDNVIATLPGKVNPDQYIIMGAHYDSYSFFNDAPGADDNASGTAAVLEVARILSQLEFDKSIVFCAFSAEEVGLIGSEYYASQAASQGMDILGYFNFDMIGYLHEGSSIHTCMIAPLSANELVDFYKEVAAIYLPDFEIVDGMLTGGDSDHTSFNNNGYMGIFPFEDCDHYSPYIHTPQDLIGPSFNSPEMAATFIQAILASAVTMSVPYNPVGVPEQADSDPLLKLYPNPSNTTLTLQPRLSGTMQVKIYTGMGQKMLEQTVSGRTTVDVSAFAPGIYVVEISNGEKQEVQRLVVSPAR